jgi:hypothetical protein
MSEREWRFYIDDMLSKSSTAFIPTSLTPQNP